MTVLELVRKTYFFRFMIKSLLMTYSDNLVEVLDYVKQSVYITYLAFGKTFKKRTNF